MNDDAAELAGTPYLLKVTTGTLSVSIRDFIIS